MAVEYPGQIISLPSTGNLSAKQYYIVKLSTADNCALQTSQGGFSIGVLQNTPSTDGGDGASVMINGITKVVKASTGNAISHGSALVSSTAGTAILSTGGTDDWVIGRSLDDMAAATTGVIKMLITMEGYGSTATS